jgi:hypothetical protein
MAEGPSEPGPTVSPGSGEGQAKPGFSAREQVTRPRLDDRAGPPAHPPTEVAASADAQATATAANQPAVPARPEPPTGLAPGVAPVAPVASGQRPSEIVRYGPGVPPSQAGVSAEQVWRTGQMPDPPRRPVRVRRLAGTLITVILLVAAGVLLFLRFHHAPFHVTGAPVLSSARNGCAVNVTGRIPTNGAPGTISYQWVFTPQQAAPQPLSQSVVSGQHAVYVTVAVEGQGHGTATQQVTLQVLGPSQETASTVVKVSC